MSVNSLAVIMSVYHAEEPQRLRNSLASLKKQTYNNFDVYLAKDGPLSPELDSVIDDFLKDKKFNLHVSEFNQNAGLAVRLNDLIEKLNGGYDFIARMDTDDISIENRFEKQINYLREHKHVDALGGSIIEVNSKGEYLKEISYPPNNIAMLPKFVKRNVMGHVTVMFRSSYFKKAGVYPVTKRAWNNNIALPVEDTLMWIEGLANNCNLVNLQEPLVYVTAAEDYFNRRTGFKLAFVEYQIRNQIVKRLNQPSHQYIYALLYLVARILPPSIKKIIWKFR